jgi:hypothetical protein
VEKGRGGRKKEGRKGKGGKEKVLLLIYVL